VPVTQELTSTTTDGPIRLYEARPDGPVRGGLVVVMEAFGVNPHIESVVRRAAEAGFHAVAPDFFHRTGGGYVGYDEFAKLGDHFAALTDDGILTDVDAGVAHLRESGLTDAQIGIVGFCFGGRVAFLTAVNRSLGAAITYYGGGIVTAGALKFASLIDQAGNLSTPWLGQFGDRDGGISVDDVERLRATLDASTSVDHEIHRYDAEHGFNCDQRPAFDPESSQVAWVRTIDWLRDHLA
jgi:carboxymethylenebutenolidase